jgi:hypothetical protein
MAMHTILATRLALKLSAESDQASQQKASPMVFAGDFNFRPGSIPYRLVVEGGADAIAAKEAHAGEVQSQSLALMMSEPGTLNTNTASLADHFPPRPFYDPAYKFDMSLPSAMRSAYMEHLGQEPAFTNYAFTKFMGKKNDVKVVFFQERRSGTA